MLECYCSSHWHVRRCCCCLNVRDRRGARFGLQQTMRTGGSGANYFGVRFLRPRVARPHERQAHVLVPQLRRKVKSQWETPSAEEPSKIAGRGRGGGHFGVKRGSKHDPDKLQKAGQGRATVPAKCDLPPLQLLEPRVHAIIGDRRCVGNVPREQWKRSTDQVIIIARQRPAGGMRKRGTR